MGVSVLILGFSGSGKSTSLRNFVKGEVGVFNVAGKPLPFRGDLDRIDTKDYALIKHVMRSNNKRAYVIDDANYLMAFQNFEYARQKVKGYDKFTEMSVNFESLLEVANSLDANTITYFLMHPEVDDYGRVKPKTIGKMLDNQLCIEGMFPIVLRAMQDDQGFHFQVTGGPDDPVKAPMGMFDGDLIDNDLKMVDGVIREYWSMGPIVDGGKDG